MNTIEVVAGIIFNASASKVLLALRKPAQHQGGRWEFPGGKLEAGESQSQALCRELYEEINIQATQLRFRQSVQHDYSDKSVHLHFWDVTDYSGEPLSLEGQQLQWFALGELSALEFPAANQLIVDQLLELSDV